MDENNQYGMAMTKPLPCGCIKRKEKTFSFEELDQLLKSVTLQDKIGHIFTIDIEFSGINPKTLLSNEIYLPILEKKNSTTFTILFSNNEQSTKEKK